MALLLLVGCDNTPQEVDIDLTDMSITMAYAFVDNIIANRNEYIGQVVKMRGAYYTDGTYHFILLIDETNCCSTGFEFVWQTGEEFPDEEQVIEVTGTLGVYDGMFCLDIQTLTVEEAK